jgi:hypothetical protein
LRETAQSDVAAVVNTRLRRVFSEAVIESVIKGQDHRSALMALSGFAAGLRTAQ